MQKQFSTGGVRFPALASHFEWVVLLGGLVLMATLDPYSSGTSWCLLEWAGVSWCPGEGLGHAVAFLFRGEFRESFSANLMGLPAVLILAGRIGHLLRIHILKDTDHGELWQK